MIKNPKTVWKKINAGENLRCSIWDKKLFDDEEIRFAAVKADAYNIGYVPDTYISEELIRIAIESGVGIGEHTVGSWDPSVWGKLSDEFLQYMAEHGDAVCCYAPVDRITSDLLACSSPGWLFEFIRAHANDEDGVIELVTKEAFINAVSQCDFSIIHINIPEHLREQEVYEACADNGFANIIPRKELTRDLVVRGLKAHKPDYYPFPDWVPKKFIDAEIAWLMIGVRPDAIKLIPDNLVTYEMAEEVVGENGLTLHAVPPRLMDENLCVKALQVDSYAYKYVPYQLRTKKVCELALQCEWATPETWAEWLPALEAKRYGFIKD